MGIAVEIGLGTGGGQDWSLQGFGKNVTGGGASPTNTYTVTSSAATGAGSFDAVVPDNANNCLIQFAVSSCTVNSGGKPLGSNVTIDGLANGQNGVTLLQPLTAYRALLWEAGTISNVLIRGIRFEGTEGQANDNVNDLVTFDGTGGTISGVAVDRCTFVGAGDGTCDLTGFTTDVTVQRCLFYGTDACQLIKYNTRQRITLWGNVYAENNERQPQIHGECDPFEYVNNIVKMGGSPSPWVGLDVRGVGASEKPTGNIRGNYFYGSGAITLTEGGYTPDVYVNGNTFTGGCSDPGSPRGSAVSITEGYQITPLSAAELEAEVLDKVGAPNRTARDDEIVEDVRAVLP